MTELNSAGALIGNFAPIGSNFDYPGGVALDSSGNLWVTNVLGNSVTELDSKGALVGNFAPPRCQLRLAGQSGVRQFGQRVGDERRRRQHGRANRTGGAGAHADPGRFFEFPFWSVIYRSYNSYRFLINCPKILIIPSLPESDRSIGRCDGRARAPENEAQAIDELGVIRQAIPAMDNELKSLIRTWAFWNCPLGTPENKNRWICRLPPWTKMESCVSDRA